MTHSVFIPSRWKSFFQNEKIFDRRQGLDICYQLNRHQMPEAFCNVNICNKDSAVTSSFISTEAQWNFGF